ncbi:hypothetical protein JG688_00004784 [Phytophthora aleatoria]|uniref:Uncharacterized protein n=1 Tax=Phytophthora aleatoria TaxID=2496075 RepID=A0A8J5J1L2_9STRA|nr:hypothetical protein JG688_00004784 [Phytophthora aleatoria]
MHRGRELDEVAAALADVQARQQSLARGSVLSRASSPSPSVSAVPSPSPSPPPVSKEKTQRAAAPFLWLKRRVVRCSDRKESDALEDLGSLELVSSASLASVRALIGQFIVLPPRREFVFVHPTTNTPVTAAEESDICAGDLPFICLVLLPVKEPPAARDASTVSTVTISRTERKAEQRRPETAHTQQQPEQKQLQPQTVAAGVAAAVPSDPRPVPVVKRDRVSPGAVRTGRERQVALQPVQEERKQSSIEAKTEAAPLHAPTKLVESKRATAEVKLAPDSKRASKELRTDLKDPIMTKAFDDPHARDEYYRLYHAKKGLGELVRVWMPTSGRLGLQLWQERHYALIGTLVSVTIALWLPVFAFPDGETNTASKRNTFMTRIVYGYGIGIFLLAVVSIALIAQNRFVLLEQTRLRLRPVSRYYQNVLAVTAIGVELVQLNSLAFDSAMDWDSSDELPATVEWLGNQGITTFGFSSAAELEALGVLLLLLFWFLLLKCANKFRETSALLHRVLTKDLPALVHGFLYMSTISVFFSYLACMDCSVERNSNYEKCKKDPQSPPFLIAHKEITCWTAEHQWFALLGLWGITFFLPIGLLAHGMSQVLFQRETLDIKYAPVLILVVQLVKAAAATAQAFFPSDPILLASLGAVGNAVLLVLTLAMHSCSLWYIKYLKCGIYAASCWASLGAIHLLDSRQRQPF